MCIVRGRRPAVFLDMKCQTCFGISLLSQKAYQLRRVCNVHIHETLFPLFKLLSLYVYANMQSNSSTPANLGQELSLFRGPLKRLSAQARVWVCEWGRGRGCGRGCERVR